MDEQPPGNKPQTSQTKPWSDAELRRVARVFDLLIRIDQRKRGKGNEEKTGSKPKSS